MNISFDTWNGWETVRCLAGDYELIIGISAGPRVLSLRYRGGDNLLYIDHTGFKVADWFLYGGHRFTVAPESDASYLPDNDACEVAVNDSGLVIAAPVRKDGIRLSLEINGTADAGCFNLVHILENCGPKDWIGALWAITCVPRNANIAAACENTAIHLWPNTDPANWLAFVNQMTVKPGNFRGKAGWHHQHGWLSALQPQANLVIHHADSTEPDKCVDGGCNLELFVCSDFAELETLGESTTVSPGGTARHHQQWRLSMPFIPGIDQTNPQRPTNE